MTNIIPYIIIGFVLVLMELMYFQIANRFQIIDKPNERSSHSTIVLRGGGIIFLFGAWLWSAFFGFHYPWFLLGLTILCSISFIDDIHSLPYSIRLVAQFIAVILLFIDLGIIAWPYWWIIILALIVCVGIINAYNFMDGINGITGGYSIAVLIPLIVLNNQHAFIEPSYLIVTTIACGIFCFFNFRPKGKARCFAGDIGSIGIAFILMLPMTKLILHTGDITYILFLAIYGVDSILTICHRIMLREHLGQAHRKHAFQIMTNELHIPHEIVASAYSIVQLALSIGFIYWSNTHWLYLVTSITILSIAYVLFIRKYYHLHETYLKQ